MRRLISLLFIVVASISALYIEAQPKMKFDKTTIDLGELSVETPVQTAVFEFINTGDTPLVITNIRTSCGCTKAEYPKEPIAPGQKGKIKVEYNGENKTPGYFNNTITVYNNTPDELYRIFIKGKMLGTEGAK